MGHEFVGVIEAVGEGVDGFAPGEQVSGEGHIGCGHCYFCRTGQGHICRKVEIIGVDRDGCFAQFMSLPQSNVWKVRPGIPPEVAAIFDPLGNAMHTVMAQPVAGKTLAIVGAGAIGLMACKIARAAGALRVLVVEPQAQKRAMAVEFGAEDAYDPTQTGWFEEFAKKTSDGVGADVVAGSRYMRGGRQVGGPLLKRTMSRAAGLSLHWLGGLPVHDATSNFRLYSKRLLNQVTIESRGGFELGLELTVKAYRLGMRVAEVPTTWRDRTAGQSRFKLLEWLPRYLHWYWRGMAGRLVINR